MFRDLAPFISVDAADRIELHAVDADPGLVEQALQLTVPCCRCGNPVRPFRRRADPERRAPTTGAIFVSCACPMDVAGCARGKDAKHAKAALIAAIRKAKEDNAFMSSLLERV
jgi:hypothetical protein